MVDALQQTVDKVDRWTRFVHCDPPCFSKPAGRCLFMIEYKTYKYIREEASPRWLSGAGGRSGQKCPPVHFPQQIRSRDDQRQSRAAFLRGMRDVFRGSRVSQAGLHQAEGFKAMSQFDDLPLIQCKAQPVPVGHPEHPDFSGYEGTSGDDYPTFRGFDSVPGWAIQEP